MGQSQAPRYIRNPKAVVPGKLVPESQARTQSYRPGDLRKGQSEFAPANLCRKYLHNKALLKIEANVPLVSFISEERKSFEQR